MELAEKESGRILKADPAPVEKTMEKFTISKDVLAQELDGETVLLDLASESYFGLDEVSTRVWQMLNEGQGRDDFIETLSKEYEVRREVLAKDIDELLARLDEAGLIRIE
jgi:ornithine carbamoyltransferase